LAKLNAPLFFDNYSLPICLPKQSDENKLKVGSLCHVIGWGRDYGLQLIENQYSINNILVSDPESNGSLKQVEVPIVDPKVCVKDYKNIYKIDTKLMLCAGYEKGGHDSCFVSCIPSNLTK
jgi:hypothetical protein